MVALYRPIDSREPHHWAVYMQSQRLQGSIQEVYDDVGGRGYYVAEMRGYTVGMLSSGCCRWVGILDGEERLFRYDGQLRGGNTGNNRTD